MIDFGIIAAGQGSRLKKEGSFLPKPLLEIEGQPMIGRLISIMESCGASSVNIVYNSEDSEVERYLNDLVPQINCTLKFKSADTPSSMHTFYELLRLMKPTDKFIVTTVDTIFKKDAFSKYVEYFEKSRNDIDGLMGVTTFIDDESPLYVETEGRTRIVAFEDTPHEAAKYISAGIYGLHKSAIQVLQGCMDKGYSRMRNFQRALLDNGLNLEVFDMGKVIDIDHLSDIAEANNFLADI